VGLEVEAERRGQGLVLGGSEHRGERGGVTMVRVEQRQAGEEVRTGRDLELALSGLENCTAGNKRGLNFRVGGRQSIIRFSRKNIGERESWIGGHGGRSESW
jgi:hypothetical protein